jgi:hypothetical protein
VVHVPHILARLLSLVEAVAASLMAAASDRPVVNVSVDRGSDWAAAAVGVVGALIGAGFGAWASYRASMVLADRNRVARAMVRRKAKLYKPLREELSILDEVIRDSPDAVFNHGIRLEMQRREFRNPRRWPELALWEQFRDDGRSFSASKGVRLAMDQVAQAIQHFNDVRAELLAAADVEVRRAYAEVMGEDMSLVNWSTAGGGAGALLELDDWHLGWQDTPNTEQVAAIKMTARGFALDAAQKRARTEYAALERQIAAGLSVLDEAIERIASKYERELPSE